MSTNLNPTPSSPSTGQTAKAAGEKNSFTILYFAGAQSYTSLATEQLPAPLRLTDLFATLEAKYPGFTARVLASAAVTLNLEYVDVALPVSVPMPASASAGGEAGVAVVVIQPGDEVGIVPPVSGG